VEDIPQLARVFLGNRTGKSAGKRLSDGALKRMLDYHWPGNVRELRNTLARAAANHDELELSAEQLEFTEGPGNEAARASLAGLGEGPDRLAIFERELCAQALAQNDNVVSRAAVAMGKSESAFRRSLVRYGLLPPPQTGTSRSK
jgi:DNA-binding NtrC family response regulator